MAVENLGYFKGLGDVYRDYAPFDQQLSDLDEIGIKYPVGVREDSLIRLSGKSLEGTRTCHAPILARNSPVIIARISPLAQNLEMARQAVSAHRNGQYPVFPAEIYSQWHDITEKDKNKKPENSRAIVLPERGDYRIDKDSIEARFFWQNTRKRYFERFVPRGSIPIWQINPKTVDSQDGTIINYTWFGRPENESDLNLRDWALNYDYRAFGVLKKTGGAGSPSEKTPPSKTHYTQKQIKEIYETIEEVRKGNLPASKLEKALQFLDRLKQ